jgi:type I restriction enzyme S subunit
VIAAEGRKLEALRTFKKGLLQNLFPREGETTPRLRFPEFRDAGEWTVTPFGTLYEFQPTNTFSRDQLNYDAGSVKNIHYGDIHTKFESVFRIEAERVPFVNDESVASQIRPESFCKEGDMIFADASEDLADVGKSIEVVSLNDERLLSGSHTILARQSGTALAIGFGAYLFQSGRIRAQIQKEAQGTKVLQISPNRLAGIHVCFPHAREEQHRIAYCLSSLDALITAQANKLATLKLHKQGLMQSLFPAPEDITT